MGWRNGVLDCIRDAEESLARAKSYARLQSEGGHGVDPAELTSALFATIQNCAEAAAAVTGECMPNEAIEGDMNKNQCSHEPTEAVPLRDADNLLRLYVAIECKACCAIRFSMPVVMLDDRRSISGQPFEPFVATCCDRPSLWIRIGHSATNV